MRRLPGIAIFALIWAASSAIVASAAPTSGPDGSAGPARVVSMNLCTDQLAMLLAAPGQLASVSYIARDSRASAMATEARAYPVNHGLAEEIYLLSPDLVIAGAYSTFATTAMLKRLGLPVVVFQPANSLADVRDRILQMGDVLGRQAAAQALLAQFDADIASLALSASQHRPRAALYSANGYTSGPQSLAGQILQAAGLDNIALELGYRGSGQMPLELLAMAQPDMLVASAPYPRASRSEDILDHPIVRQLAGQTGAGHLRDADWVCGTPHVLRAITTLAAERDRFLTQENSQ